MTTAVAEPETKERREAQRFVQKDIPKLIKAFNEGGIEAAYALFPHYDKATVKKKLIGLQLLESARPTLTPDQKRHVEEVRNHAVSDLAKKIGTKDGKGDPTLSEYVLRALMISLRELLPKKAQAEAATEDAATA